MDEKARDNSSDLAGGESCWGDRPGRRKRAHAGCSWGRVVRKASLEATICFLVEALPAAAGSLRGGERAVLRGCRREIWLQQKEHDQTVRETKRIC